MPEPPPARGAREPVADDPDAQADAAAAAAIAMAMSSLPWTKEDDEARRKEPSGFGPSTFGTSTFGPLPGRPVPREPGLGPQSWTMPGPSSRRRPANRRRREPTRAVAAVFGLVVCLGMAGWYVAENPAQIAGWLDPSRSDTTASAQTPAAERPAAVLSPQPVREPIERVLTEQPRRRTGSCPRTCARTGAIAPAAGGRGPRARTGSAAARTRDGQGGEGHAGAQGRRGRTRRGAAGTQQPARRLRQPHELRAVPLHGNPVRHRTLQPPSAVRGVPEPAGLSPR